MRRDLEQHPSFAACLKHQMERALLEIANAAVDETRRMRGRAGAEVGFVHERRAKTAQCRVARNPCPRDATANDEHIHGCLDHGRQGCGTGLLQLPSTWGWW